MDLGQHAAFIWASYAVVTLVISGLIAWIAADGKAQRRALRELESRGVRRRSMREEGKV